MSLCARATSILESSVSNHAHSPTMAFNTLMSTAQARMPAAKPYQPGISIRACDHENTHGIARKSSIWLDLVREAGRDPILRSRISEIGVALAKKSSKAEVLISAR